MSNEYNFNEMITDYLFDMEINNLSRNTIDLRSSLLKSFFKENDTINDKVSFNKAYKQYVISKKQKDNISEGYVYQLAISLKSFTKYHKLDWWELKTPKVPKSLPKHLSKEEINKLFNIITPQQQDSNHNKMVKLMKKSIIYLLYSSGLRVSECAKLKSNEIDFENNTIIVRGKGNKDRIVLFNDETKHHIKQYLKYQTKQSEYLYPSIRGQGHISPRFIEKFIKECGENAGITQKVTPHILRHSFATHLLGGGCNIRGIQQLLGHSSLATTQIYTSVEMSQLKEMYNL